MLIDHSSVFLFLQSLEVEQCNHIIVGLVHEISNVFKLLMVAYQTNHFCFHLKTFLEILFGLLADLYVLVVKLLISPVLLLLLYFSKLFSQFIINFLHNFILNSPDHLQSTLSFLLNMVFILLKTVIYP